MAVCLSNFWGAADVADRGQTDLHPADGAGAGAPGRAGQSARGWRPRRLSPGDRYRPGVHCHRAGSRVCQCRSPGTLLGFIAAQVLAALYALSASGPRALAPLVSVAGFIAAAALLTRWQADLWSALALCLAATFVFHRLLRKGIDNTLAKGKVRFPTHLIRGLFAGLVVVLVTGAAEFSPPLVAGALAAFPITFFPLLVLLHWQYGAPTARTLVRHYPAGLGALIAHTLVVALAYPRLGIVAGTLLALTAALCWSLFWLRLKRKPT